MGIEFVADERDRKTEGMRQERKRLAKKAETQPEEAAEEMNYRELEISRTALLNPDPEKAYRLVNRDAKGRIGVLRGLGYKIVPEDAKVRLVTGEKIDGGQVHGDLVLMETPIENYERRRSRRALDERYLRAVKRKDRRSHHRSRRARVVRPIRQRRAARATRIKIVKRYDRSLRT